MKHHRILIRFFFVSTHKKKNEEHRDRKERKVIVQHLLCTTEAFWACDIIPLYFLNALCAYYYIFFLHIFFFTKAKHTKKELSEKESEWNVESRKISSQKELIENSLSKMKMSVRERYTLWFVLFLPFYFSRLYIIYIFFVVGIKAPFMMITIHELHEWYMCVSMSWHF